jgi:hypothetical protein
MSDGSRMLFEAANSSVVWKARASMHKLMTCSIRETVDCSEMS